MVRADRWKLIYYPHLDRYQLFDLKNAPDELKDLTDTPDHRAMKDQLKTVLRRWQQQAKDPLLQ